jgi:phage terminase large subunit-like protein
MIAGVDALDDAALARWQAQPIIFIETVLRDPETRKPFVLSDAERAFLTLAFTLDDSGRLKHPELVFGAIKKSGKTTLAALIMITMVLLFGGRFAEGYCVANDFEQAASRVFTVVRRIVECSPLLRAIARITSDRVLFPALDASIIAIASDAASAAGANPTITCFDELWGYSSERSRRLWDEMITTPARRISCRLTVSYAGFSGESILLAELYKRGQALPEVGPSLHAGDGMLFAWHTEPIAPWQTEAWLAEMRRSLRPSAFARMITNEFVATESAFVDLSAWDACVVPSLAPLREDKQLHVWAGVDASVKRDSTALVLCAYDKKNKCVRLIAHKVFTPTPGDPIDFEQTIEQTILEWREKFLLRRCYFDPFQMVSVAQRLQRKGLRVEEFAQTIPNLTAATSNLYDLISSRSILLYPDAPMRLAVSRAILHESSRGWRLDKQKQQHKIDLIVALSMAAYAAVIGQGQSSYETPFGPFTPQETDPVAAEAAAAEAFQRQRFWTHLLATGGYYGATSGWRW